MSALVTTLAFTSCCNNEDTIVVNPFKYISVDEG